MPDYHIWIHGNGIDGENGGSPFKPQTLQKQSDLSNFQTLINESFVEKASPYVAIGLAVAKTTDKILTTGFDHLSNFTGNYQYSMAFNNVKSFIGATLNPVGVAYNTIKRTFEINKYEKRVNEQRQLVGSYRFNRKVGV